MWGLHLISHTQTWSSLTPARIQALKCPLGMYICIVLTECQEKYVFLWQFAVLCNYVFEKNEYVKQLNTLKNKSCISWVSMGPDLGLCTVCIFSKLWMCWCLADNHTSKIKNTIERYVSSFFHTHSLVISHVNNEADWFWVSIFYISETMCLPYAVY